MLTELEPNRVVRNVPNFELFDKKSSFLKPFLTSIDAMLQDVAVAEKNYLMVTN